MFGGLLISAIYGPISPALTPRLPIDTPSRGLAFRALRWLVHAVTLLLVFGPGGVRMPWLIVLVLASLLWTEWKRASIRRKLSPEQWPKPLFL